MFDDAIKALLKPGGVGVIPTDTVYGLVARAEDQQAVARAYQLKSRDSKPAPVIAASVAQLVGLGLKARYLKPVEQYWPGPVSVIIPHDLAYLSQGVGAQPFRLPNNKQLIELLERTGPLVASSANLPGQPVANTLSQVKAYFGDQVDFYVDGGDLSKNLPSTIIRIIDDAIEVVREGAVKIADNGKIT
ncbi:MAG TPA: L-threonylcarbamoyladenylate synthase [Candidatus Saccharimonadales bacterium]|nr:L-threonylcarbamoyladenylate synthase [Candidatus Saccharimonadales bacterium]